MTNWPDPIDDQASRLIEHIEWGSPGDSFVFEDPYGRRKVIACALDILTTYTAVEAPEDIEGLWGIPQGPGCRPALGTRAILQQLMLMFLEAVDEILEEGSFF